MAGFGTLLEVKHKWSIDDLLDALEVLDDQEAAQRSMLEKSKR